MSTSRVLFVAYFFPPAGGVGVQRSLKFVRYLPENGWLPTVLTTDVPLYVPLDEALLTEVPEDVSVHRVATDADTRRFVRQTKGASPWLRAASRIWLYLQIPDPMINWCRLVFDTALRLIQEKNISLLYTTSPPRSAPLLGYWLKKKTGIPWVADFRDAWLTDPDRNRRLHTQIRLATIEKIQERSVVHWADRIIAVTSPIQKDFLRRYDFLSADKVAVIPNGYDPCDFEGLEHVARDRFTITYTGSMLKPNRKPDVLLRGLRCLLDREPTLADEIRIRLIGSHADEVCHLVQKLGLSDIVDLEGVVTHKRALAYQKSSDANAVIYDGPADSRSEQMMSGKVFEYLGAGRPILAIAPSSSSLARLVEKHEVGLIVSPKNPMEIADALLVLLKGASFPGFANACGFRQYERRQQTRELASLFNHLVNR